jgi:hypothetical protein
MASEACHTPAATNYRSTSAPVLVQHDRTVRTVAPRRDRGVEIRTRESPFGSTAAWSSAAATYPWSKVGGNVAASRIVGARVGTEAPFIGTPHAQIGDAALEGAVANTVAGSKIGECAGL